jgi:hypothetical protein
MLWHSSTSATSYHIQVSTNSVFVSPLVDSTVADTLLQLDSLAANTRFYWRVSATNEHGTSEYSATALFITGEQIIAINELEAIPTEFKLYQNCPNPFNPITTIRYYLPKNVHVRLTVYDVTGQRVRNLVNHTQYAGMQQVVWDGRDNASRQVASGMYFYRVETDNFVQIKKMLLSK